MPQHSNRSGTPAFLKKIYCSLHRHAHLFWDYTREKGLLPAVRHSYFILRETRSRSKIRSRRNGHVQGNQFSPALSAENGKFTIFFLSGEPGTPGHKYRISCLAASLPESRYQVQILRHGLDDLNQCLSIETHIDLLWIWRLPLDAELPPLLNALRTRGTRIHYDVDDLMINPALAKTKLIDGIRSMGLEEDDVRKFYQKHHEMLMFADHASSPTQVLTSQMLFINPQVRTVPNTFTSGDLIKSRKARLSKKSEGLFRMGYASGSRTHQKDFEGILPAVCEILRQYPDSRLVVYPQTLLLNEYPDLAPFEAQIEKREMVPVEELVYEYAHYDVNLCPLETGNIFCECKSQLKFFEAALCKTPTVASPTDPFAKYIHHGENGFLANTPEEWTACLQTLAADPQFRSAMGERAYRSVLWAFSPDQLRLSLESVFFPSVQAEAHALRRRVNEGEGNEIALPGYETVYQNNRHAEARITVILPCYNYAHYLVLALDSVAAQTLNPLDVVVVDDGSTDDSLETALTWIKIHQNRFGSVKLLKNFKNSKLARTRNAGVDACETEFYFPLDPDNYLEKDCLEKLLEVAQREKCGFVYPSLASIGTARQMPVPDNWSVHLLQNGNYIDAMALIRKSTWVCVGGYTHDSRIVGWEDFEFWCKCGENALYGKLCSDAVAYYRAHEKSMLATITDQPGFLPVAKETMRTLHPWLVLP